MLGELKKEFRPEFLNRVDDIIVFRRLTEEEIKQIAANMLKSVGDRLAQLEVSVKFDKSVTEAVAKAGFDQVYGARPLRRAVQSMVEDTVSEALLDGSVKKGGSYKASCRDGKVVFKPAD